MLKHINIVDLIRWFFLTLCMQPLHYKAHILFVCVCLFAFFISNSFPNKFLFSFHPKSPNMNFNCVIFFVCKFGSSVCVLETPDYLDNWRRLQDIRTVWISTWQHRFVTMSTFHSRKMSRSHCSSLSQFIKVWMRNYILLVFGREAEIGQFNIIPGSFVKFLKSKAEFRDQIWKKRFKRETCRAHADVLKIILRSSTTLSEVIQCVHQSEPMCVRYCFFSLIYPKCFQNCFVIDHERRECKDIIIVSISNLLHSSILCVNMQFFGYVQYIHSRAQKSSVLCCPMCNLDFVCILFSYFSVVFCLCVYRNFVFSPLIL